MSDKFRRATYPRHVRIFHRLLQSAAWRSLSGSAAKVLLTLAALEKGDNNGEFFLSARTGAEMTGLGKNAVNRALHELQEKGFIYCAERGGFSRKTPHAARWGLTWAAGPKGSEHRAPSHAYEKWRPEQNRGPRNRDDAVPETRTVPQNAPVHSPQIRDSEAKEMVQNRQTATVPKTGTHTSYQGLSSQSVAQHHRHLPSVAWWQPDHSLSLAHLSAQRRPAHIVPTPGLCNQPVAPIPAVGRDVPRSVGSSALRHLAAHSRMQVMPNWGVTFHDLRRDGPSNVIMRRQRMTIEELETAAWRGARLSRLCQNLVEHLNRAEVLTSID